MDRQAEIQARAKKIRMIIFDVDGVLTDGGIYMGETGELFKPFHARDGLGITLAQKAGLQTGIITGRDSAMLAKRAAELKITAVWQGKRDKRAAYCELKQKFHLQDEEIAYVGDDLIDLPVMVQVGFPAAVGDAVLEVRNMAAFVASQHGGQGAVREILEFILKAQGKWEAIVAAFQQPVDLENLVQ